MSMRVKAIKKGTRSFRDNVRRIRQNTENISMKEHLVINFETF